VLALLQAGQHAGQRAGVVGQRVGPDRDAHRLVGRQVAVGVDHHGAHLRLQAQQRVQRQRHAQVVLQALVDAAHAAAAAAGEDKAGDVVVGMSWVQASSRSKPWVSTSMNSPA
jgi:hypothetical protein